MSEHLAGWADSAGHWLLAWAVVVAAVVALRAVCRPRRASVRYGGWLLATFSGVGLLLIVLAVSPVVTWKEIGARFGWSPSGQEDSLAEDSLSTLETDERRQVALSSTGANSEPSATTSVEEGATLGQPTANSTLGASAVLEPDASGIPAVTTREWSGSSVMSAVFCVWLTGVCFFLGRLARHAWLARGLVRHGLASISTQTSDTYQAMRRRLGMARDVRLAVHEEITTPVCVGAIRPVILWPAADNDRLNRRERAAAMAHELAHLRRYDEWVNLAAELWRAVTWFFPPVHWTIARFRREQEFLCDDLAARELESPADYAQMLLQLTPVRLGPNVLCFTIERGLEASKRVRRLIDPEMRCVQPPGRLQMIFLIVLGLSLVAGAGSLRLVGFSNRGIAVAASTERDTTVGLEAPVESRAGGEAAASKRTDDAPYERHPRPQVLEVYPPDGADGLPLDTEIRIRFDRPMDPSTPLIQWEHGSEGGYRPRGEFRYLEETREFVLPVRLKPGCSHQVVINQEHYFEKGEYMGFSSVGKVAAKPHSWSFVTARFPARDGRRPKLVAVEPPSDSQTSLLTLLRVKFDVPMDPTWYGLTDRDGASRSKPELFHFVEYDSENHEFTLPLKLPANWNGQIELVHFRNSDGVESAPITLEYRTKREPLGADVHERAAAARQSAELVTLVNKIRAARAELTSVWEEICMVTTWGSKPGWLDRYECQGATFKMRGDRRFLANIDEIMRIPFRVGSDGTNCWLRRKDEVFSCPYEEIAEKNVLFGDPFGAGRLDDTTSVIEDMKLEYLGRVVLEGRPCHRIRSWDVKLASKRLDLLTPVRDWYIDAQSFLPVRIERDGLRSASFDYVSVNEPIPDDEFRPETGQGIEARGPEPLDENYTRRYLNVVDGSNGRMSVRWGKIGPKGTSSSGLN